MVFAEGQLFPTSFSSILFLCENGADGKHMMLGQVRKERVSKQESYDLNISANHIHFNKVYERGINNYDMH